MAKQKKNDGITITEDEISLLVRDDPGYGYYLKGVAYKKKGFSRWLGEHEDLMNSQMLEDMVS